MLTDYHSQYYAHELTRRYPSDRMEKLSQSLFNATVDLNPHQKRDEKRKSLFEEQDRIDQRKEELISKVEARLKQQTGVKDLFTIRWRVV